MKKKVIFSVLAICLVAGMVGIGTWAYFSDIETSPGNVFEAGTLDLVVDDENPLTSTMFDISNVQPGYAGALEVVAENIGTCPGIAFIHLRQTCNEDNGIWEPEDMVDGVFDGSDGTANGDLNKNLYVTIEAGGSVIADGSFKDIQCTKWMLGDLLNGESMTILLSYEVPDWVGNIIQSDRLCFDIDFILDQKVGEAAFEIGNLVQEAVVIECNDTTISVDVTNTGTATGVVTVSCDIDGIHMEKTVAVEAGATVTVDFTVHLPVGSYLVNVSIPGMPLDPCPVEVVAPGAVGLDWEEAPADTIYVCDNIGWLVVAHNGGGVTITADVTLTVTVGTTEKFTETKTGVVFDPCEPVILTFGPWHAEDDPLEYSGTTVVDVDGVPGLSHSFTLVDLVPTAAITSPTEAQEFDVGAPVSLVVHCTDDVMVIGGGYTIDDPMATPIMLDGTPGPVGDWTATIDTSGMEPGTHTIYAGCLDSVMQQGVAMPVGIVLRGAVWEFSNLSIPTTGYTCEDYDVSVDLHNGGNVTASYSVTVTADGWSHTFTGSLAPCDSVTLSTTLHFNDPGVYTVTFGPLTPVLLTISIPQITWAPGDFWVFDSKYDNLAGYTEDDTETVTLVSLDPAGSVVGGAGFTLPEDCYKVKADFVNDAGGDVERDTVIGHIVLDPTKPPLTWSSTQTMDEVYREAVVGALHITFNFEYLEEAAYGYVPTADHGWPYNVGKEWGQHSTSVVYIGAWGGPVLTTVETYVIVEVVGQVSVTVPAGTFTVKHVAQWEILVDAVGAPILDGDGHWQKTGAVGSEMWYNMDLGDPVKYRVKYIDRGTYTGELVDELESYIVAP